jgi:hypothetical protein
LKQRSDAVASDCCGPSLRWTRPTTRTAGSLTPPQEITVRTCQTVGELIRHNFLYLLDCGEHDTLRRLMEEAANWLDEVPLPTEED